MKKPLLILLSLIMCASVFASCNTETDNSSDVSVLSDNESSGGMTESSANVSDTPSVSEDSSDTSIENVSEPESTVGLEKVSCFEGIYGTICFNHQIPAKGLKELYSAEGTSDVFFPGEESESLTEFLERGDYDKETYFLVGLNFSSDKEEYLSFLSDIGFIADESNMFIKSNNPLPENYDSMTDAEKINEQVRRLKLKLSDAYVSKYGKYADYGLPDFDTVGFITADGINSLKDNKSFGTEITWFPSPDDKERWITGFQWMAFND